MQGASLPGSLDSLTWRPNGNGMANYRSNRTSSPRYRLSSRKNWR